MRPALALAALAIATGGAVAAPAGFAAADGAVETIGILQAQGYTVNVDRVGSAELSDCTVVNVRNPQEVTRLVRVGGHGKDDRGELLEVVVRRSISVSLDCSN